ncbi:hypothetical protein FRB96_007153, partial [Tulasnella sp. 330]
MESLVSTTKVPQLRATNWNQWLSKVKAKIIGSGAWVCINPGWSQPTLSSDPTKVTSADRAEMHDWVKSQGFAKGAIMESVSDANLRLIKGKDAKDT